MKTNEEIRDLAIKTHEYDASKFQAAYSNNRSPSDDVFLYGRIFIEEEILKMLKNLPKGSKILDIGSGTGHLAAAIKNRGFEVYGLEPSKEMLNYARENFPDIESKEGISIALPYPERYFDFVISIEVLRYLSPDDVINTYKEIRRVLKNEGNFLVTHVNRYATDFYYCFYKLKDIIRKIMNHHHHYCYFTTAEREMNILRNLNFSSFYAHGRMFGSIRIAYKLSTYLGKKYVKLLDFIDKDQLFEVNLRRFWAGHLFLVGKK